MERVIQMVINLGEKFLPETLLKQRGILERSSIVILGGIIYCSFHALMGQLHLTHIFFVTIILALFFLHTQTRSLVILSLPLLLQNALYDSLRYIPFNWIQPIHVRDLYELESKFFGVMFPGGIKLPHEILAGHTTPFFNFLFGVTYHLLDPVSISLVLILWRFHSSFLAERYSAAFLLMNFFAFSTYLLWPSAPPWYVAQYGLAAPSGYVLGNPAGLTNLDVAVEHNLSGAIYGLCPFVYGAVPSMHAGFTMLGFLYARRVGWKLSSPIGCFAILTWIAALYLQHHYTIDVVMGILYATTSYMLIEKFFADTVKQHFQLLRKSLGHLS